MRHDADDSGDHLISLKIACSEGATARLPFRVHFHFHARL